MSSLDFDVAIVGYGPVGQTLAALLGQHGWRVGVFERWPTLYPLPRACVIDHEAMRVLQSVHVAEPFSRLAVPTQGEYVWLNARGETLYHFRHEKDGISGWPSRSLMYQPELEACLDRRARELPSVQVHQGWEAASMEVGGDAVQLGLVQCTSGPDGLARGSASRKVTARYVVGADGANSFVRAAAGIAWTDLGFRADWLVVDFRLTDPGLQLDMPEAGQICDPARPTTLMRRMGHHHVRWEMMLLPGETAEEITQPQAIWPMIVRWVRPQDGEIERAAVYTFRSGVAEEWVRGRVMLAGDAAHLMPPFLGQGLCSGVRDAVALGWRLDLLLRGVVDESLLGSYEQERKRHVATVIERAVALGKVVCITDPQEAARRDAAILSGTAPPVPPFPALTGGLLHRDAAGAPAPPAGQLSMQPCVEVNGRRMRLDDAVGAGWRILTFDASVDERIAPPARAFLERLNAKVVNFGAGPVIDCDGRFRDYLAALGAAAVIVRPDFYVYGVARSAADMPNLLAQLQAAMAAD